MLLAVFWLCARDADDEQFIQFFAASFCALGIWNMQQLLNCLQSQFSTLDDDGDEKYFSAQFEFSCDTISNIYCVRFCGGRGASGNVLTH